MMKTGMRMDLKKKRGGRLSIEMDKNLRKTIKMMMMTVTRTTDFNLKKQICCTTKCRESCGNEII